MQRSVVMTIIGQDRPGLVESVAATVADHGGNWLESRMSHLGGQFAGILRVEVAADRERSLMESLRALEKRGLQVVVHAEQSAALAVAHPVSVLELVGQDRPGIVRQISRALAKYGVNVEELQTECASAAMSGETLFKARAKLAIPPTCNVAELRGELEKIAGDLIVEISLGEASAAPNQGH